MLIAIKEKEWLDMTVQMLDKYIRKIGKNIINRIGIFSNNIKP